MVLLQGILLFLSANWFSISLTVCLLIILYFWGVAPFRRSTIVAAVGDLPGPTPLPFVGNLFDIIKHKGQMHLQFHDYSKKYGRLFTAFFFSKTPSMVVNDPEMLKEMFVKEFQSFHDRPVSNTLALTMLLYTHSLHKSKFWSFNLLLLSIKFLVKSLL